MIGPVVYLLYALTCVACAVLLLLALERAVMLSGHLSTAERAPFVYMIRLVAFVLIIVAIVDRIGRVGRAIETQSSASALVTALGSDGEPEGRRNFTHDFPAPRFYLARNKAAKCRALLGAA